MADRPGLKLALRFAAGAVVGGALGYGAAATGLLDGAKRLDWQAGDMLSLALAAMLLALGVFAATAGAGPGAYRRLVERSADAAEPLDPEALPNARRQAAVLIAAGLALAIPPLAMASVASLPLRQAAMAAIVGLLLVESLYNWRLWRRGDELTRRVIVESFAVTFWITQFGLFLFAALAHMALVGDVSSWVLLQLMLAVYLVTSVVIGVRRGIAEP